MKVTVLFYSVYGHIYKLAQAVAEGVGQVGGLEAVLRKAPETLSPEVLGRIGALEPRRAWEHIPEVTVADLEACQGLIIGTPTRFGCMCGQIRQFLDSTGGLFATGAMIGKVGGGFTSSNTQHGGQETTIWSLYSYFLHQGMVIGGLPYSFAGQMTTDEIVGGSPYGASTIAGEEGKRQPSTLELDGARYLGRHLAELTAKLFRP